MRGVWSCHLIAFLPDGYVCRFGVLAGVLPPTGEVVGATAPGVPLTDSLDMWPLLSGTNKTSPRSGFALSQFAIRVGDYKYINGSVHDHESWNGKVIRLVFVPPYFSNLSSCYNNSIYLVGETL